MNTDLQALIASAVKKTSRLNNFCAFFSNKFVHRQSQQVVKYDIKFTRVNKNA